VVQVAKEGALVKSEFSDNEVKKLRKIARLETWVMRLKDLLSDVVFST